MKTITEYGNDLERDLLKAHELLKEGLQGAMTKFRESADQLSKRLKALEISELKAIERYADDAVSLVEGQLGALNYLEAEGEIDSLEEFDRLTTPLSDALERAREMLSSAEKAGDSLFGHEDEDLKRAWQELRIHIELARIHLTLDAMDSKEEIPELREQLGASMKAAARKANNHNRSRSIVATAFSEIRQLSKVSRQFLRVLFNGTLDQSESPPRLDGIQD